MEKTKIFTLDLLKKYFLNNGIGYQDKLYLTKKQLIEIFDVDNKIIDWYIEDNLKELNENGYKILDKDEIKEFYKNSNDIDLLLTQLEIFSLKATINMAMLMFHTKNTMSLREDILKIVIDHLSKSSNKQKKPITKSQDKELISTFLENKTYNRENIKRYIFKSIFQKKADEYQNTLRIKYQDKIRAQMNSDIMALLDRYYDLIFQEVKNIYNSTEHEINEQTLKKLIKESFENQKYTTILDSIKSAITNRNMTFMNALYKKIKSFPQSIDDNNIEEYINSKCKNIEEKFLKEDNLKVLINLQKR